MLREEVKVELATGLAHDHSPMSANQTTKRHHHHHNQRHHKHHNHSSLLTNTQLQPLGCLSSIQDKTNIPIPASSVLEPEHQQQQTDKLAQDEQKQQQQETTPALATIAILRRHPMFDSLVLVKKYRACLQGHTLEFPTSRQQVNDGADNNKLDIQTNSIVPQIFNQLESENDDYTKELSPQQQSCNQTKLVSVYLDGDDPIFQSQAAAATSMRKTSTTSSEEQSSSDIVYVPINGLLDRLDNYSRHGISIDSRVYAFAMGLKTAERFLTSSSEKEIQEAPQLWRYSTMRYNTN